jgi:hypothetical protein
MHIEPSLKLGSPTGPSGRGILIFVTSLCLALCPLALPAQSTNSVAPATVPAIASTNFALLISGSGSLAPSHTVNALQTGKKYTLTAMAAKGSVFAGWVSNGVEVATTPKYTFIVESNVVLQANFIPNPFLPVVGTYHGLFYVTNDAAENSSGSFVATVTKTGAFTAKLRLGTGSYSYAGKFSVTGVASKSIRRPGLTPLTVELQLGLTNGPLTGAISDGTWTADLVADAAVYSKANPAPQAGKYTLLIPGSENASAQPGGNGFGAVTVSASGTVTFSGILGDGTAVTSASIVSSEGQWPFYVSLYGGKGSILGWLSFTNAGGISGQTGWFKLPQATARLYPGGFTNSSETIGSVYQYTNGLPLLGFSEGELSLTNGNLTQSITNQIGLGPDKQAADPGAKPQSADKLTFRTASGLFKGSVVNPETGKPIVVNGVVLQNQNFGAGVFLGATESGSVLLSSNGIIGMQVAANSAESSNTTTPAESIIPSVTVSNAVGSVTNANADYGNSNPFAIYDQQDYPNAPQIRLGYWQFDTLALTNQAGLSPNTSSDVGLAPAWSGNAISMTNTIGNGSQLIYPVASNGQTYLDCANGTVRFWFQPNWSTTNSAALAGQNQQMVFLAARSWSISVWNETFGISYIQFASGNDQYHQPWSFKSGPVNGALVSFQSNLWYQIVLSYSPTNVALYTNGVLLATANWAPEDTNNDCVYDVGNGNLFYPPASDLGAGFSFGSAFGGLQISGQLEELETFNYPLTAQQVAAGFPAFAGVSSETVMADSNYVGRSDMLQQYVDGSPANVAQCRLGYWRFDSTEMYSEQGQMPLSFNDISLVPGWSGTALDINSDPASQVTYWDVFTNGWANINCRQGCLRFWFKPNWKHAPGSSAPFVYLGNPNSALSQWALSVNSSGAITFVTASNSFVEKNLVTASLPFDPGHWMQIVLNYGPNGTALYTNGALAATGSPVTLWPDLSDRNRGMVIGNTTAYSNSIDGQFDEIETFNYQLDPKNILSNFQTVQAIDSDLDGIPDLLEDIVLPASKPFLPTPVVITGTIEAEQFDMGGPGIAYQNLASNPPSSYRPTGMFITHCDDLGLGYCLDQTRAGEWAVYTINVLVPQTYTIETRVGGIGTDGVFECEFTATNFYTNTGPLTITTTNWTNVSAVVFLTNGIYTMKLHCLGNGTDGAHVGRFNYISIYPWWQAGFASTNRITITQADLSTNNNWADAANNAAVIQSSVNAVGAAGGGTVSLPSGTYYVAQASPNETNDAWANAAVSILTNNIEIAGAGETNTTLIAFNRATTVFSLGGDWSHPAPYSNLVIRSMTIEAQPHLAVFDVTNTTFELGQLFPTGYAGTQIFIDGYWGYPCEFVHNILITNCQFLFGDFSITFGGYASNCLISHCDFNVWGGTNVYTGATNSSPANTPNTTGFYGSVGIFGDGTPDYNINILDNTYNGNTNLAPDTNNPFGYVSTNATQMLAPNGFVYFQSGGNYFIARNTILNYELEGVQLSGGPSSVVGNTYYTLVSVGACCALAMNAAWTLAVIGTNAINYSACFIGNSVYGGRNGQSPQGQGNSMPVYCLNFSGNELILYPPFAHADYPGAAVSLQNTTSANVFGNTLVSGGHGVVFASGCGNAVVMNNDFANVSYRGVGLAGGGGSLRNAAIFNNILGQGVSFHVELPYTDSFGWFLEGNTCLNGSSNSVPPFLDPLSSAVHMSN